MFEGDWYIRDKVDETELVTFQQANGTPIDFTGSTFRMDIKSDAEDEAAVASLTTANGGIISTDLANGQITLAIEDFALSPGTYVFDLIRINGAARNTILFGELICTKGVTGL